MPKLPTVTGKKVVKAFESHGFVVDHINGSHHIMMKEGHPNRLSVPVHGNKDMKKGLLNDLIKLAGLTREEFIALL